jgi:hypothetical protein
MRRVSRLPDFSVVVWLQKTDKFVALKTEVLDAAVTEPYESTEYQGMVDFHWSAATLPDAKRLAEALTGAARHPELVLLHIMSRVDGVDSISIKDERRARHSMDSASHLCNVHQAKPAFMHWLRCRRRGWTNGTPGSVVLWTRKRQIRPSE